MLKRFAVLVDDQLGADLFRIGVAKLDHLGEFVAGVNVQQRKGDFPGEKGFLRQAQHHRGVFADGIQHHRAGKFRRGFTENVDAFCLQSLEMVEPFK